MTNPPLNKRDSEWKIKIARMLDDFPDSNKFRAATELINYISSLLASSQAEVVEKTLEDYSAWLHKKGYIDSDYYTEGDALAEFLESYAKSKGINLNEK